MSRLENKKKAGYFPTPNEVTRRIALHLAPPESGVFRWLDPCAGEGTALAYLAQVHGGETFGIELDKERAQASAQVLDHALWGDFQAMQLPKANPGISVLFLNPPYDHDDEEGGRLELTFLRESQDWLMPGGVLVYIIPQYRITNHIANRLATHFENVEVYRFLQPFYDTFRQVVIFATKRAEPVKDQEAAERIYAARQIFATREIPPYVASFPRRPLPIPPAPQATDGRSIPPGCGTPPAPAGTQAPDFFFRRVEANPEEVLVEADKVGVRNSRAWADLLTPQDSQAIQPLMPLRRGHIAMILAAGLLDNMELERDGSRALVKGRLVKATVDISSDKERQDGIQRTREEFRASICALDLQTGDIATVANESDLRQWFARWQEVLAGKIVESFKPLHDMSYQGLPGFQEITGSHSKHRRLPGRSRTGLFEAQRQAVAALARRFLAGNKFAWMQATMGTGKTTIAVSLADVLKKTTAPRNHFPVIVACPPHLIEKWPREIAGVVPMARATVIRRPSDLEAYVRELKYLDPRTLSVAVVSSEMLKRGSGWTPAVQPRTMAVSRQVKVNNYPPRWDTVVEKRQVFACPRCGKPIHETDESGRLTHFVTDLDYFANRRAKCLNTVKKWVGDPAGDNSKGQWEETVCGEPLYQEWRGWWPEVERDGFGHLLPIREVAYPIAQFIRKRYPGFFELAVVDEVHEYKGQSTDRGDAFGVLARASKRTLAMTGTLFGGMATSLFYLLHRVDPRVRAEFAWSEGQRFAALYGVLERVSKSKEDEDGYGHYTGLRRARTRVVERPGISPALVTKLLDSTVFLALEDLGFELPDYREYPVIIPMKDGKAQPNQAATYRHLHDTLQGAAREDWSLMSEYLQTTLAWPNACWRDEQTSVGLFPALPANVVYPKEDWLVEKCLAERRKGRRVLLFVRQTATRDIQPRLQELLSKAGLKTIILYGSVPTHRREAWVANKVKSGLDVLICNPRLVQTGLDLVDFPTIVFYEPEYSVYLVQQASRRSWRLGQTQPVDVYYAVYSNTMEHRAVAHIGKKIAAAQLLYGDDVAGALVDQACPEPGRRAGVGGSLLEELAREVMSNSEVPDLGEVFVQKSRDYEGGWLSGQTLDLSDRPTDPAPSVPKTEAITPVNGNQLTLF